MQNLTKIQNEFSGQLNSTNSLSELENLRVSYLGKKGALTALLSNLKNLDLEEKKKFGAALNKIKVQIATDLQNKKDDLELVDLNKRLETEKLDLTTPVRQENKGLLHPITKVITELENIFSNMGFTMADGPEIEDDFHNFSALNIAKNHPARQMQDTFYLSGEDGEKLVLRTHTSSVQIRNMKNNKPPFKMITMGKVYRCDSDQTHTPMFHQIEGLVVDKNINMGHLRWILEKFLKEFFEVDELPMRFRPSFFPFTEPSAELDIGYTKNNNQIKIGGSENFMEILGCGMVHPNVLKNVGVDPDEYQGLAFGVGIERLAMLKYGINDLRMFFDNDIRFLKHYGFVPKG